jgi:hypothetical protein
MAVSDEDDTRFRSPQRIERTFHGQNVVPNGVGGAPVEEFRALSFRLRGQALEVRARLLAQHGSRPACTEGGVERELVEVDRTEDPEIMVSGEPDSSPFRGEPAAGVRARPVADDVAEGPDLVGRVPVDRVENGL